MAERSGRTGIFGSAFNPPHIGHVLVVEDAGAYGAVMSSHYNTRARPAEVVVRGGRAHLVTPRQPVEYLLAEERRLG